ncbi:MAG: HK97 family phage prohead protease [Gammaproteobacteria bacterium]
MSTPKFHDLPLAPKDTVWDAAAADKRVRNWAKADKAPNPKYAQAFFWFDGSAPDPDKDGVPDRFGDYKLPFADVIGGSLTAVPKGIYGAAAAIQGARGGVQIPVADRDAVKADIKRYYAKMAKAFDDEEIKVPWQRSSSEDYETRTFIVDDIEVRAGDDAKPKIIGHAAVFSSLSQDLGGFREKIAPGAFKDTLNDNENDPVALFNHNPDHVLGRKSAGTLRLKEDDLGLHMEIDPPDTQAGRDVTHLIKRGDINKMSFGFRTNPGGQSWDEQPDKSMVRTLKSVKLLDVSPVTSAAYQKTHVAVRALEEYRALNVASATVEDEVPLEIVKLKTELETLD